MALIIAHRGASAERPENTIASVKRAIELSVDCIEIDVHVTKDLVPVLMHDSTTHRTTNADLSIEKSTFAELKRLDAGSWFHPRYNEEKIPTLQDILKLNFRKTSLMIEIKKSHITPHIVAETVLKAINDTDNLKYYIGSFDPEIIQAVKNLNPKIDLLGIVSDPKLIDDFLKIGISKMVLWHCKASKELIHDLQSHGIPTWVFTIDTIKESQKMVEYGVEGIITNDPATIIEGELAR